MFRSLVALSDTRCAGRGSREFRSPHPRVSPRPTFPHLARHHTPLRHPTRDRATRARQSEARNKWRIFEEKRPRAVSPPAPRRFCSYLPQAPEPGHAQRALMHEDVGPTIFRRNESKPLHAVEPLHLRAPSRTAGSVDQSLGEKTHPRGTVPRHLSRTRRRVTEHRRAAAAARRTRANTSRTLPRRPTRARALASRHPGQ